MQVFGLPGQIIKNGRAASRLLAAQTPDIEAARRRDAVARWRRARADGLNAEQAARAVGVPRSTLYRWGKDAVPRSRRPHRLRPKTWTPALRQAAERLRQDFPMWGRAKIGPLLRAEGFKVSDATVGRMLAELVARGVVQAVPTLRRRPYARRWTAKRRFARRLPRGLAATEPGGLVQLDTVFVNLTPTKAIKHFTAYDPIAKWTVGKAFNRASAQAAAAFLDKIVADMPFPVKAIQVDGGSEFMAEFEVACQTKAITLYVLPPRSPQMNGAVERCNGAWRYEFYETYDLPSGVEQLNPILDSYQHLYNHHRPHGALAGRTPAQYLARQSARTPTPSHMS
jgi:transposase InsO family protein